MRITTPAVLCLLVAAAPLALAGCTKTKIKNSTVEYPVQEHRVIVTEPGTTTTTTSETYHP